MKNEPRGYADVFNPKTFTVEDMWKMYCAAIMPKDVSPVQFNETKNAFYAGFLECFKMFNDFASELDEDEACELFNRLAAESSTFFETLVQQHQKRS